MPILYDYTTGKLKTPELTITQSTGNLIFQMSKSVDGLDTEVINLWIERTGGTNITLATKIKLKDFLHACLFNEDAKQMELEAGVYTVVANFAIDGGLNIQEGDKIKMSLENLKAADSYGIKYTPDFFKTNQFLNFETKGIPEGYTDHTIDVQDFDVAIISYDSQLTDVGLTTFTGDEKRFTPDELQILSVEERPSYAIDAAGKVYNHDSSRLIVPLEIIKSLRFYKGSDGYVSLTLVNSGSLTPNKMQYMPLRKTA